MGGEKRETEASRGAEKKNIKKEKEKGRPRLMMGSGPGE